MEKRIRLIVSGIAFLSTMSISSLLPVLPSIAEAFSISLAQSGLVIASFAVPGLFFIPVFGVLADRFGRKCVLMPALVVFLLGGIWSFCSTDFIQLLVGRVIQGIGAAPLGVLCSTITADTWEGDARIRMMGINGLMLGLGTAFSPFLGGVLGVFGWRFPFLLSFLAVGVFYYALPVKLLNSQNIVTLKDYFQTSWDCIRTPTSRTLLGLSILTFIILSGPIVVCFPLLASEKFSASPLQIGLIMAIASLFSGLMASNLSFLHSFFKPRTLLLISQFFYMLALFLMPLVSGLWWLLIPIFFYGAGQGLNIPLVTTMLTGQAPNEHRGALMSVNAMAQRFAQGIGPLLFGGLAEFFGTANAIFAGLFFALIMMYMAVKSDLPEQKIAVTDSMIN